MLKQIALFLALAVGAAAQLPECYPKCGPLPPLAPCRHCNDNCSWYDAPCWYALHICLVQNAICAWSKAPAADPLRIPWKQPEGETAE